jgi:DivIVA domain-containing protein
MDYDDPEKRIAELERQLAERRRTTAEPGAADASGAPTTGGWLTAEQVRNMAFSKPPIGKRGYNEDEVDAFLDHVEAALREPSRFGLTAEQVRGVAFSKPPIGRRGYNEDEVDAFLDLVERQVSSAPPPAGFAPPTAGPLAARHGLSRHAAGETWLGRTWNVIVGFVARFIEDTP